MPKAPIEGGADVSLTMGELLKKTVSKYWAGTKNEMGATRNARAGVDFFGANTPVTAISSAKVDEWVTHLQAKGDSGATINRKLAALSKMLKYAERIEVISKRPIIERQREGMARERYLRAPEAQAVIALLRHWAKEEEATFTTFLLDTGARVGEGITVRVMDLNSDRVTLGATGSKNGEWRVVPLTKRLQHELSLLRQGRPDHTPLFRINRTAYAALFKKAAEHLNLGEDVVLHTLRHTCASWLVQRGVDLRRVQAWMGHKSITTTLRYAKLAPSSLFEAVSVLDNPPTRSANGDPKEAV